jgi:dihydrofolate reductase
MQLVSQQFISLDGVYQGPGSPDEDRTDGFDRGGWLVPFVDPTFEKAVEAWTSNADAFLFGRRTYEDFGAFWPTVTNPDDRNATRLNTLPKYVATRSGNVEPFWKPGTVLTGDVEAEVASLKQQPGREMQIHGSGSLTASMFRAGLIDEVRLVIAPVVVGAGRRLFTDTDLPHGLELLTEQRTPRGLYLLTLRYTGRLTPGTYDRHTADIG